MTDLAEALLVVASAKALSNKTREVSVLEDCVADAVAEVAPFARTRDVSIRAMPYAAFVRINRRNLSRVLRNLIENAVRFSPAGGTVLVEATRIEDDVLIAITDDGPGIPNDDRERVFEPFARAADHGEHASAGLGLSIARSLARAAGGEVAVGQGAGGKLLVRVPVEDAEISPLHEVDI